MSRFNIRELIFNFISLVVIQLPLLYRITIGDHAFAFFYVGFLLTLPFRLSRSYLLLIGFFVGLIVDVFSNTPGIHAGACVFVMYVRDLWLTIVHDDTEELTNINHVSLGKIGFVLFMLPPVLIHHFLIFTVENGGVHLFGTLMTKTLFSSIFSLVVIFVLNYLIVPAPRRI